MNNKRKGNSIIDWIWDFFSSLKVGMTIVGLLAVGSAIGTIYPQTNAIPSPNPDVYYLQKYGELGDLYHRMGLTDAFNSWWYLTLVLLLAISLVIVSIDRGVPLYKSLKNQPVARKVIGIKADRLYTSKEGGEEELDRMAEALKKRRYKVRREAGALLAEKGRFPRFGPYVLHAGLIIIILGVFSRLIPGWYYDDMVWLKEGERKEVSELGFSVENKGFVLEYYDEARTRAKKFETDVAVYEGDKQTDAAHLIVNKPLKYEGTYIFQNSFDPTPMFKNGTIELVEKNTGKSLGTFDLDFNNPQAEYKVGEHTLTMVNYFPDIRVDLEKQDIYTNSTDPYNPGIQFDIMGPGLEKPSRQWMMPMAPFVERMLGKEYLFELRFKEVDLFNMTGLLVHRDFGVPIVYTGTAIVLWGLVLCYYFQHRRIWARLEEGVLHVGANTNKNWLGMRTEFNKTLTPLGYEPAVLKSKAKKQQAQQTESAETETAT